MSKEEAEIKKRQFWDRCITKWKSMRAGTWKPETSRLSQDCMYQIVAHLCRFMLREVISPDGRFHEPNSELGANHVDLCRWGGSRRPYEPNPPKDPKDDKYDVMFF